MSKLPFLCKSGVPPLAPFAVFPRTVQGDVSAVRPRAPHHQLRKWQGGEVPTGLPFQLRVFGHFARITYVVVQVMIVGAPPHVVHCTRCGGRATICAYVLYATTLARLRSMVGQFGGLGFSTCSRSSTALVVSPNASASAHAMSACILSNSDTSRLANASPRDGSSATQALLGRTPPVVFFTCGK